MKQETAPHNARRAVVVSVPKALPRDPKPGSNAPPTTTAFADAENVAQHEAAVNREEQASESKAQSHDLDHLMNAIGLPSSPKALSSLKLPAKETAVPVKDPVQVAVSSTTKVVTRHRIDTAGTGREKGKRKGKRKGARTNNKSLATKAQTTTRKSPWLTASDASTAMTKTQREVQNFVQNVKTKIESLGTKYDRDGCAHTRSSACTEIEQKLREYKRTGDKEQKMQILRPMFSLRIQKRWKEQVKRKLRMRNAFLSNKRNSWHAVVAKRRNEARQKQQTRATKKTPGIRRRSSRRRIRQRRRWRRRRRRRRRRTQAAEAKVLVEEEECVYDGSQCMQGSSCVNVDMKKGPWLSDRDQRTCIHTMPETARLKWSPPAALTEEEEVAPLVSDLEVPPQKLDHIGWSAQPVKYQYLGETSQEHATFVKGKGTEDTSQVIHEKVHQRHSATVEVRSLGVVNTGEDVGTHLLEVRVSALHSTHRGDKPIAGKGIPTKSAAMDEQRLKRPFHVMVAKDGSFIQVVEHASDPVSAVNIKKGVVDLLQAGLTPESFRKHHDVHGAIGEQMCSTYYDHGNFVLTRERSTPRNIGEATRSGSHLDRLLKLNPEPAKVMTSKTQYTFRPSQGSALLLSTVRSSVVKVAPVDMTLKEVRQEKRDGQVIHIDQRDSLTRQEGHRSYTLVPPRPYRSQEALLASLKHPVKIAPTVLIAEFARESEQEAAVASKKQQKKDMAEFIVLVESTSQDASTKQAADLKNIGAMFAKHPHLQKSAAAMLLNGADIFPNWICDEQKTLVRALTRQSGAKAQTLLARLVETNGVSATLERHLLHIKGPTHRLIKALHKHAMASQKHTAAFTGLSILCRDRIHDLKCRDFVRKLHRALLATGLKRESQISLIHILGNVANPRSLKLLTRHLNHRAASVRRAAAGSLRRHAPNKAILLALSTRLLSEKDHKTQAELLQAIHEHTRDGQQKPGPILRRALQGFKTHPREHMRTVAKHMLQHAVPEMSMAQVRAGSGGFPCERPTCVKIGPEFSQEYFGGGMVLYGRSKKVDKANLAVAGFNTYVKLMSFTLNLVKFELGASMTSVYAHFEILNIVFLSKMFNFANLFGWNKETASSSPAAALLQMQKQLGAGVPDQPKARRRAEKTRHDRQHRHVRPAKSYEAFVSLMQMRAKATAKMKGMDYTRACSYAENKNPCGDQLSVDLGWGAVCLGWMVDLNFQSVITVVKVMRALFNTIRSRPRSKSKKKLERKNARKNAPKKKELGLRAKKWALEGHDLGYIDIKAGVNTM